MLSEAEEIKLNTIVKIIETSKDFKVFPKLNAYEIEWLAEKCKELNHEASKYSEELYKANKDLADFREHYEG